MEDDKLLKMAEFIATEQSKIYVASGDIDPEGKTKNQILAETVDMALIDLESVSEGDIKFVMDYRQSLKIEIKDLITNKKLNLALTLTATWYEHFLNSLIDHGTLKKHLDRKEVLSIIRQTNTSAKQTWLIKLLELPPLDSNAIKVFSKIAELRNSFVHYKYNHEDFENNDLPLLLNQALDQIKVLEEYEITNVFKGYNPKNS